MKKRVISALVMALGCLAYANQNLTFEDRVKAQEAIERVYYNHRIWPKENPGPKPPFEQMMPRAQIEAKVTDYLKKSAALDKFWQRAIKPEQLQAEMERMAKGSKDPDTLRELFTALNNDPYLIAECLARPALADRLIRNWYASDSRFHAATKEKADAALKISLFQAIPAKGDMAPRRISYFRSEGGARVRPPQEADPGAVHRIPLPPPEFDHMMKGMPRAGSRPILKETREAFLVIRTRAESGTMIDIDAWLCPKALFETWWTDVRCGLSPNAIGRVEYLLPTVHEQATSDCEWTWGHNSLSEAMDPRAGHTAVWTGMEMIIWGGGNWVTEFNSGFRYDPASDTWQSTSIPADGPIARGWHTAVWTGTEMIIWGGIVEGRLTDTGGIYNPQSDTWLPTSTGANCPSGRSGHTAVWTGTEMIIWGGETGMPPQSTNTGGRFNLSSNSWTSTDTGVDCPIWRSGHTAVWTGTEMIVWGGFGSLNTGGRYHPADDTWSATSTGENCPSGRAGHSAIWTGSRMILWGGGSYSGAERVGAQYDPQTDTWVPTSTGSNCPSGRSGHTSVWTGTEMIIWGGSDGSFTNTGGRYDPVSDTWLPTSLGPNCPSARCSQTAVWSGSEMIIWGGNSCDVADCYLNTGARYDPSSDTWVPTACQGSPLSGRIRHTAVWTGTEMVIWGGEENAGQFFNSGGNYYPSTDSWIPTSTGLNCPSGRALHAAAWTGMEMMIWGGYYDDTVRNYPASGGRYHPSTDAWLPTSIGMHCPSGRYFHTLVWTGIEAIVWGGWDEISFYNTGGRYDPMLDTWAPTSAAGACPSMRCAHAAVWTGTQMIIWGGYGGMGLNTGGRYDPSLDTWLPTSVDTNCPLGRDTFSAVWTGMEMIIWGGWGDSGTQFNTGGRYDPVADAWSATGTGTDCPSARCGHTAVWTGTEMIIWGGAYYDTEDHNVNTGGLYEPISDTWKATPLGTYGPSGRAYHTAVWTGASMIIWGGSPPTIQGGILAPGLVPAPAINGPASNACPSITVALATDSGMESYQWYRNGMPIAGATASGFTASVSGLYAAAVTNASGCWGISTGKILDVTFCATVEVSPLASPIPLRIARSADSSTGLYIYFEKIAPASGYNIYEGNIGTWYSHGGAPGNICSATVKDRGAGEMRAELVPNNGDHYYLVTAHGGGTEGPIGYDSSSVEIDPLQSTCAP